MKNSSSASSTSNVFDSNTTSTVEVSAASVTVSTPTIFVTNNLDGDRAVIPTTQSEDRFQISNSSSIKREDDRSIRGYLTDFSVNASQSEIDGNSSDEEDHPQQRCNRGFRYKGVGRSNQTRENAKFIRNNNKYVCLLH